MKRLTENDEHDAFVSDQLQAVRASLDVSYYAVDFTVDTLVNRLARDDMFIPSFQRKYVWTQAQASRFVESLLLGLPVPGIFLAREEPSQRLLIVDGLQRLLTLDAFINDRLQLAGVTADLHGLRYRDLSVPDRRRFQDSILHATIIESGRPDALYLLFERINTGGTPLTAQEVRSCVFDGPFIDMLRGLAHFAGWTTVYGSGDMRGRDEELILRLLAVQYGEAGYRPPMHEFLSDFLNIHRDFQGGLDRSAVSGGFEEVLNLIAGAAGRDAFRPFGALNSAFAEALYVAVARCCNAGTPPDSVTLGRSIANMKGNEVLIEACRSAATSAEQLRVRIGQASFELERCIHGN